MSEKTTNARFLLIGLLFALFTTFSNTANAANKYWIGGSGDWSDASHWRNTSGGFLDLATPAVPSATDNAIFDNNSGAAGFTVSSSVADTIHNFTASSVNACTFSLNLLVTGNFSGSTAATTFGTGTQTLAINALTANSTFTASSTTLNCNLTFEGTGAFIANVAGGFTCSKNLSLINGKVTFATATYNINTFSSALPGTDSRVFNFNNATFNVSGSQWNIQQLNGDRPNIVNATNISLFDLNDVHSSFTPVYTTLNFSGAKVILRDSLSLTTLAMNGDSLLFASGALVSYVNFTTTKPCTNPLVLKTLAAPYASMHYTGSNDTSFVGNLHIVDVSARDSLAITYAADQSTFGTNAKGWVQTLPATYYWIGNSGNWTDVSHWSTSSGGPQACFYPPSGVNVVFDQNSFSSDGQTVVLDTSLVVKNMTWAAIDDSATFHFITNLYPTGNVTFNSQMTVNRDSLQRVLEFTKSSHFNPANCFFDCNLSINTVDPDTLILDGNLNGSDSASLYHLSGRFVTNSHDINAQAYYALLANSKRINLGASNVFLRDGWDTDTLISPNFSLTAGTSKIVIGRSKAPNFFQSRNQTFNEVIFDFNPRKKGTAKGSNTINELTITPGSWIEFEAGKTTTFDSLHIDGGCNKFKIDSTYVPKLDIHTISIDTVSAITTVYDGYSNTGVFGYSVIPKDSVSDTLITYNFNNGLPLDTTVTKRYITRAHHIDTLAGPPVQYHYLDSITEYIIHKYTTIDTIGYNLVQNFSEDFDTLTGRQEVLLVSSVNASAFTFNSTKKQKVYGLKIKDGHFTGGQTQTAYFSTDVSNNTGWTFNTSPSTTASFTAGPSFCFGDTTTFTNTSTAFSGSASDLIYTWDYDETTQFGDTLLYSFLNSGDHKVKLTSYYKNGCKSTFTDTITIYKPTVFFNMNQPDARICAGTSVLFTASALNDSMTMYQFYKNGVSLGAPSLTNTVTVPSVLNSDSISVVASLMGCYAEDTLSFVFQVDPLPAIGLASTDADNTICAGTSVTFTASGGNIYQFYKNNATVTGNLPNATYTNTTLANNDYVYVIGTNVTTQCKDTSIIRTFTVNPLPGTTLSESTGGNTICAGDNVTFTAGGASTYEFFIDNVSQGAASATTTFSTTGLTSGQVVKVAGYSAAGCMNEATSTYSYTVNALPVTALSSSDADLSICQGEPVVFSANGGGTYEFFVNGISQGAPSGTSTFSTNTLADNDQVRVNASFSGCNTLSSAITMDVRTNPTTNLVSDDANDTVCQLQSVTFTGTGATNYEFLVNGTSVQASSSTATYTTSTLNNGYVVTLIGESNNCFVSDQITFGVLGIPNVNIISSDADNNICFGDPITFTGTGANDYELLVDGVPGTIQASPTFTNPALPSGSHNISIRGTATNGCTNLSTNTIAINVNAFPTVGLTSNDADNIICAGTNVTFTGSGATSYQFYIDGVSQTSMSSNNTYNNSNLTTGQVVEVFGSTAGCVASSNSITITSNPVPAISLTSTDVDNVYCEGTSVTYTSGGGTTYEFLLDGTSLGAPSAVNTYNASTLPTGSHTLQVLGTTAGCSGSSNLNIQINGNPTAAISSSDADNTICAGNTVTFTASGGALYQFFVNGTSQGAASPLNSFSSSTLPNGASVYAAVINATGCSTNSSNISTIVNATPTVSMSSSDADNTICSGTSVVFTGSGASTYEFFVNGVSTGAPGASTTYSNSSLTNGQSVNVVGYVNGCPGTATPITTTVYSYPAVSLSNLGGSSLCSTGAPNVMANGATTYEFFVNGISQGAPSGINTFTTPVPNNAVLTVQGSTNGCLSNGSNSITFTVIPTPVVSLNSSDADLSICFGQNVTFTASGSASNYEFRINNVPVQSSSSTTYSTSALENGDVVTLSANNGICLSNVPLMTFVVNTMDLELTANPSELGCIGDNISLVASGSDQYEFFLNGVSQGPSSANATFSSSSLNSGDSIYFIGYNNTTGCYQTLNYGFFPDVVDGSVITVDGAIPLCFGDSVILSSNHVYGNQWLWDGNMISGATDPTYTVHNDGLYALQYTAGGNNDVWSKGYNGTGTIGDGTNLDNPAISQAEGMSNIVEMSSGYDFVLARNQGGNVYAWGENGSGQLGNGTFTTTNEPQQVPTLSNIVQLATTSSSSAALTASGQIYVWGNNNYGQLGVGSTAIINFPFLLSGITNIAEIVGGKDHFVILKTDGTVWTVGNNSFGQLASGNLTNSNVFVQVAGLSNIWHIGSGENHSFAISNTGELFVWGANINGQLGLGDLTNRVSPVLSSIPHIKDATGGANHTILTTDQKEIYVIGDNAYGQLGTTAITSTMYPVKLTLGGIKQVSAGEYSTLLLLNDSRVYASGYNAEQQLVNAPGDVHSFTELNEVDGVRFVESGKRTSHFVFGGATTCNNASIDVIVNTPVVPTITENGFDLTSSSGTSYQWYRDYQLIPGATSANYTVFATGYYYVAVTDNNGCTGYSDTLYFEVAGIKEFDELNVSMFPNPTRDLVTITFDAAEGATCTVFDAQGKMIQTTTIVSGETISLSDVETGVYFFELKTANGNTVKRIVKN